MYYCNGKKDFCRLTAEYCEYCPYFDNTGGEEVEANIVKRFWKALCALVRRK